MKKYATSNYSSVLVFHGGLDCLLFLFQMTEPYLKCLWRNFVSNVFMMIVDLFVC